MSTNLTRCGLNPIWQLIFNGKALFCTFRSFSFLKCRVESERGKRKNDDDREHETQFRQVVGILKMEFRLISTLIHFSFSLSLSFRCHSNILLAVLAVKRSRKGRDSRLSSSQLARKKASSVREKMPRRAKWKAMTVANGHETRSFLSDLTAQRGNRFFSSRFFFAPPRKKLNEKIGDEL